MINNSIIKKLSATNFLFQFVRSALFYISFPTLALAQIELLEYDQYRSQGSSFGFAVAAFHNNQLYIGAPFSDAGLHTGATNSPTTGSVQLHSFDGSLTTTLAHFSAIPFDQFGSSISVSTATNGNPVELVGTPGYKSSEGAAHYLNAHISSTLITRPGGGSPNDKFGYSVKANELKFLIGAPGVSKNAGAISNSGAVYYFDRGVSTTFNYEITNPDSNNTSSDDKFGSSVAFLGQSRVAIGSPGDDDESIDAGAVWIFDNMDNPSPVKVLPGNNTNGFGFTIEPIGKNLLLVGAPGESTSNHVNAGSVYVVDHQAGTVVGKFDNPMPADQSHFGSSISVFGDFFAVGAPGSFTFADRGKVYLYSLSKNKLLATYKDPNNGGAWPIMFGSPTLFGSSIALFRQVGLGTEISLLIGAPLRKGDYDRQGAAYIFKYCEVICSGSYSYKDGQQKEVREGIGEIIQIDHDF